MFERGFVSHSTFMAKLAPGWNLAYFNEGLSREMNLLEIEQHRKVQSRDVSFLACSEIGKHVLA